MQPAHNTCERHGRSFADRGRAVSQQGPSESGDRNSPFGLQPAQLVGGEQVTRIVAIAQPRGVKVGGPTITRESHGPEDQRAEADKGDNSPEPDLYPEHLHVQYPPRFPGPPARHFSCLKDSSPPPFDAPPLRSYKNPPIVAGYARATCLQPRKKNGSAARDR